MEPDPLQFCDDQQISMTSFELSARIIRYKDPDQACNITIANLPDITVIELFEQITGKFTLSDPSGDLVSLGRYLHHVGSPRSQYQTLYRQRSLILQSIKSMKEFSILLKSMYDIICKVVTNQCLLPNHHPSYSYSCPLAHTPGGRQLYVAGRYLHTQ